MTTFSDNFTGTANAGITTYSASYSLISGSQNNALKITAGGTALEANTGVTSSSRHVFVNSALSAASTDQISRAVIVSSASDDFLTVILATRASLNINPYWYGALLRKTAAGAYTHRVIKVVNASSTDLIAQTGTTSWVEGDTVEFRAIGVNPTTLSIYVNGSLLDSTTDSDIDSGRPGIGVYRATGVGASATFVVDDWYADDAYVDAPASITPLAAQHYSY